VSKQPNQERESQQHHRAIWKVLLDHQAIDFKLRIFGLHDHRGMATRNDVVLIPVVILVHIINLLLVINPFLSPYWLLLVSLTC
jgi:hypothetical protein